MGTLRPIALVALLILGLTVEAFAGDRATPPRSNSETTNLPLELGESPALFEPRLKGHAGTIELPAAANEVAAGGGGRYLVAHMKAIHALAIVDLCNTTVAHVIELPAGESHFAVGLDKIFVSHEKNSISRYDLRTAQREVTAFAPEDGVQGMWMGCAAVSPLIVASGKSTLLYDPQTFHAEPITWEKWGVPDSNWPSPNMRVSGDGQSIVAWGGGWAGIELAAIDGLKMVDHHKGYNGSPSDPARISWSGSVIFTGKEGILTRDLSAAPIHMDGYGFGALSPNYVLALKTHRDRRGRESDGILKIYLAPSYQLIAALDDLRVLTESGLPPEQRIWFVPSANLLAIVGAGNSRIYLRRFSATEALEESGIDYLLVTSIPNPIATRGWRYSYSIQTLSKRGGVSFSLSSGPPGMSITPEGIVRWNVPADFKGTRAEAIVSAKDASGQAIFHTFTIQIHDPGPVVPQTPVGPPPKRA